MQSGEWLFNSLLDIWKELPRGDGGVPLRSGFRPTKSPEIMPNLFLAEVRGKYDLLIRLVGTGIEDKTIYDFTDTNYYEGLSPDEWDFYDAFMNGYIAQPCAGRLLRHVKTAEGMTYDLHTLAVPLAAEGGEVRYIAGVGFMQINHEESSHLPAPEIQGLGLQNARIADLSYVDLGHGVPELPARP